MTISFRPYLLLLAALFLSVFSKAQQTQLINTLDSSSYFVKQLNGLNALLSPSAQTPNIVITYYVKAGTVYESDSAHGIAYVLQNIMSDKIKAHLSNGYNKVSKDNTTFTATSTTELTIYQLTTTPANYAAALQLLRDSLNLTVIHESELETVLKRVREEIASSGADYLNVYNQKLIQRLYRKEASLQIVKGDTSKFRRIDLERVNGFWAKYYVPNNVIISATGNFNAEAFQRDLANTFKEVMKGDFDPQMITKVVDFKPMIYNTRFIVDAPVQLVELRLNWLFPGTRSNVQSSYCAILLCAMLNDPNNYIHAKLQKMGCRRFVAEYEANNFSGILKVTLQPDKKNFYQTYDYIVNELQRLDKTLLTNASMNMGKLAFKSQFEQVKRSKEYPAAIIKYWAYNDETYFPTLVDSVFKRNGVDMKKFIIEYLNQSARTTGLLINSMDRKELNIDSNFVEMDESINKYTFSYRRNISDLEGTGNWTKINALLQWVKENPDLIIQVNGLSDAKELNRHRDDTIKYFVDSIPTFEQVKKELVKTGTFRLGMLRALKVVKYLYDHGIDATRLKGTGMSYTSKNKEEEADNMRCTLTIEKLRKAPSLYEYHYGKPKPDEPPVQTR